MGFQEAADTAVQHGDEDVQLMLALRAGDETAFELLFRRWAGPLLRYLERMVASTASAEELVQEAFLRVYRARAGYTPDARFSTWLYTIATRLALNELRRPRHQHPHRSTDDPEEPPIDLVARQPAVDEVAHARRMGDSVERALALLPERQRVALWLTAVEGLSYAEVATALQTSEKSVKSLVHRGRSALAERLSKER